MYIYNVMKVAQRRKWTVACLYVNSSFSLSLIILIITDLYYFFTTMDVAHKGVVSKVQWASALKSVLTLDIPYLSYAHRLVDIEADGNINYAKFIERFRIEMRYIFSTLFLYVLCMIHALLSHTIIIYFKLMNRPEDAAWQMKIVENVCEKLFQVCGNIEQAFEIFDANSDGTIGAHQRYL